MYQIFYKTDCEKITTLNSDAELTHFVRLIAVENNDEDLSITCFGEAIDYITDYCPNLSVIMKTPLLDALKEHLSNTPTEQLQKEWAEIEAMGF